MRILVVEDEPEMGRLVARLLGKAGFSCDRAGNLSDAFEALNQYPYELMLLDRRLPDGDGAAAVASFRALRQQIRILILTALDEPKDKVVGLDAGADDYLAKPFDDEELMARVRARLRQPAREFVPPITIGAVTFDAQGRQIYICDQPFTLHKREFALFEALINRVNRVVPRETLMDEVYGFENAVQPGTLDALVSRLRKRCVEAEAKIVIHLVRGRGYLLTTSET